VSFPGYSEYKDSGVKWLGAIPAHWGVGSFRHLIDSVSNGTTTEQVDEADNTVAVSRIETISGGTINFEKVGYVNFTDSLKRFLLVDGDILFSHINSLPMVGNAAIYRSDNPLLHGMNLLRIRPASSAVSNWILYWLKSKGVREDVESRAKPAINQASISTGSVRALPALIPTLFEQTQIARFLDHETAKIDTLIHEQKRLIELLKEKLQAVISHAVTKGLDPDVPMKDSGAEWLGEVPEHWAVGKLRWYATIQGGIAKGKDYADEETVTLPYLRVANVQAGYIDLETIKEIAVLESEIDRYSLKEGDVLMNEGGDNDKLGRGAVWEGQITPCLHQNHVFAIRPKQYLSPEWLAMFTQSSRARSYFFLNSKQSTNLASVSSSNVMNLDLPMPLPAEQKRILAFLTAEIARFSELQSQAKEGVLLLQERRSALISAAVTGKIDVRNWQTSADESAFDEEVQQTGMETTV
tara:strand:- start:1742 stop:3145 length:1404 start_codon:yes stop_codon:yes gene_type:complete